jgi:hypothetical protein
VAAGGTGGTDLFAAGGLLTGVVEVPAGAVGAEGVDESELVPFVDSRVILMARVTPRVTMAYMGTKRFSISAREEIHDRIRAHAEAAGVDISTYMIAAAVQQMIRDDQAAASFATIDAEIAADTAGSGKVA